MLHPSSSTSAWSSTSASISTSAWNIGETDHRMKLHKGLLSEQFSIKFPKSKAQKQSSSSYSSDLDDFKLALKLQQEEFCEGEMGQYHLKPRWKKPLEWPDDHVYGDIAEENENDEDLFQADAAAALLQLKRRIHK
jgi:hypothetical protein